MKTMDVIRKSQVGALVALSVLLSTVCRGEQQVAAQLSMAMQVNGKVTETGCRNSPGPKITLEGEIVLGGVQVCLIFQNNTKGTHKTTITYGTNVVLIPLGSAITIPKQPVQGGVGGNPYIWIQFHDGHGNNLTDEIFLGRCVQGLSISPTFLSEIIAVAEVAALDCSNHPGPTITVGGTITFSGLHARFIFRNNLKGTHTAEATRDVVLIVEGSETTIPKQPVQGGAGGNPIISVEFCNGVDKPLSEPVVLGRCNQL